ncbi:MAG: DUF4864 domain-containing protein [Bacteroidota bacterium]
MIYRKPLVRSARLYAAGGYALLALLMLALGCSPAPVFTAEPVLHEAPQVTATLPAEPSPRLAPVDVVHAQVEALRASETPADPGAQTAFAFLSPTLQYQLGQEPGWREVLASRTYVALLHARGVEFGAVRQRSDRAMQRIVLQLAGGDEAAYIFRLRHKSLETPSACQRGCWVTAQIIHEYGSLQPEASPGLAGR